MKKLLTLISALSSGLFLLASLNCSIAGRNDARKEGRQAGRKEGGSFALRAAPQGEQRRTHRKQRSPDLQP